MNEIEKTCSKFYFKHKAICQFLVINEEDLICESYDLLYTKPGSKYKSQYLYRYLLSYLRKLTRRKLIELQVLPHRARESSSFLDSYVDRVIESYEKGGEGGEGGEGGAGL